MSEKNHFLQTLPGMQNSESGPSTETCSTQQTVNRSHGSKTGNIFTGSDYFTVTYIAN